MPARNPTPDCLLLAVPLDPPGSRPDDPPAVATLSVGWTGRSAKRLPAAHAGPFCEIWEPSVTDVRNDCTASGDGDQAVHVLQRVVGPDDADEQQARAEGEVANAVHDDLLWVKRIGFDSLG